ncbi:hypothetical protein CMUS01_04812 [Colletotrichum musicola]|uniref:Uncharacterized protein n=1 Tax=Colletotrichum musicola TaxID=2175873 RepID=A0A8H6KVE6_9PEZI|nr:hypothetical protein CMUS01_04812 [Colletotrichum musicola]
MHTWKEAGGTGAALRVRGMEIGSRERARQARGRAAQQHLHQIVSDTASAKTHQDPRRKGGSPWVIVGPIGRAGQCRAADSPTPVPDAPAGDPGVPLFLASPSRTPQRTQGRAASPIAVSSWFPTLRWIVLSDKRRTLMPPGRLPAMELTKHQA